jgi:hypothetical protein
MRHAMHARVCFIVRVRSWGCVRVRARARMCVCLSVCVRAHCQGAGREHGAAQRFSAVSGSANIKWQLAAATSRDPICRVPLRHAGHALRGALAIALSSRLVSSRHSERDTRDSRHRRRREGERGGARGGARESWESSSLLGLSVIWSELPRDPEALISYMVRAPPDQVPDPTSTHFPVSGVHAVPRPSQCPRPQCCTLFQFLALAQRALARGQSTRDPSARQGKARQGKAYLTYITDTNIVAACAVPAFTVGLPRGSSDRMV